MSGTTSTTTDSSTTSSSTTTTTTTSTILDQLKAKYPSQYYCDLNTPCGWYNMWVYSSLTGLPEVSDLYAMTADEWAAKGGDTGTTPMHVVDGVLQAYTPPTPVPTITSRLADLETLCQEHMVAGIYFTPSAYTTAFLFDTGAASQSKMLTSFVAASNGLWPTTAVWKIDDGSFVNMTATDVINLAKKSQAYIQACYATESDLQTKLQADLTTDITVGWPSNK